MIRSIHTTQAHTKFLFFWFVIVEMFNVLALLNVAKAVARVSVRMLLLCHIRRRSYPSSSLGHIFHLLTNFVCLLCHHQNFISIHFCGMHLSLSLVHILSISLSVLFVAWAVRVLSMNEVPCCAFYFIDRHFKRLEKCFHSQQLQQYEHFRDGNALNTINTSNGGGGSLLKKRAFMTKKKDNIAFDSEPKDSLYLPLFLCVLAAYIHKGRCKQKVISLHKQKSFLIFYMR